MAYWPIGDVVGRALRHPRTIRSTATHRNLLTGTTTDLPIVDGTVTADVNAQCRRTLNLTTYPLMTVGQRTVDAFDLLDGPGEITIRQGIVTGTTTTWVPQGLFRVDQSNVTYGPDGNLQITAPDRWLKVQRNTFGNARSSIPTNTAWQEIVRLIQGAWPGSTYPFPGWATQDHTATTLVGSLLWDDGSRENASRAIEKANSVEAFFDQTGAAVLQKVPVLTRTSPFVWSCNANAPDAVMTAASRSLDLSTVFNAIRVSTSASDVTFTPVEVRNTTPGDLLNVAGPYGTMFTDYDSPLLRNSTQALAAGRTVLSKSMGEAKQLTLAQFSNPALDVEDVIQVMLPRIDRTNTRPIELHIIDSITHPLLPGVDQQITTRSTRPDTDGT